VRTPIVAANWKMHKTGPEARAFVEGLGEKLGDTNVEAVLAPPFTALEATAAALRDQGLDGRVSLASQNVHPEASGAFTGEVSVAMIVDVGCDTAILGHSERRALFGESSAFVAEKLAAVQAAGLRAIVCIGETLDERQSGRTFDVLGAQLDGSLVGAQAERLVIAYEPVWAIGTGHTATPETAQEAHAFVRERLAKAFGAATADEIRIQYGGSVKPDNAAELMAKPDIDGALVGGASLDPESFCAIIHFQR
jgi:triosephosphate isomerase